MTETAPDEVLNQIETYRGVVYPWHCDQMGHMNVMWYVGKFDEATWTLFTLLGLTPSYCRKSERGMAAVDQRISYLKELHAGDTIVARSGLVEVRDRSLKFFHRMQSVETGELAAVTLLTAVHIDTAARKSAPLPAPVAERARQLIVAVKLPW